MTSKLSNRYHEPDDARRAFDQTLTDLGLDRIDLFLIHWPLPTLYGGDYASTWKALTEFVGDGRARSVGVSNFQPAHLTRVIEETGVIPAVNQIEVHPFFTNEVSRTAAHEHNVLVEAWSPIAQGKVVSEKETAAIGGNYGKSPAQVTLRWHIERGDIVFPKSMKADRMRENFKIFDFSLTPDEVAAISSLNQGEAGRLGPNPDVLRGSRADRRQGLSKVAGVSSGISRATQGPIRSTTMIVPTPKSAPHHQPVKPPRNWTAE